MTAWIENLNAAAAGWTGLVWVIVWQSTLLAALVAVFARLLRKSSPAVRYWLWQILAIKLLLMPFWTVAVPLPWWDVYVEPAESAVISANEGPGPPGEELLIPLTAGPSDAQTGAAPQTTSAGPLTEITWQAWLLASWALIVLWQFFRIFWQRARLARVLRLATQADSRLGELIAEIAERLGLQRTPSVILTRIDCSPFVCGILQPTLVLPRKLTDSLEESQLRQVLLHELAHVKRRDLLWGWIPEIARVVYFFHPVAHWVNYRVRLERELACDQLAMAHSGQDAAAYAQTLVRVVSHASEPAILKTAAATSAGLDGDQPAAKPQEN